MKRGEKDALIKALVTWVVVPFGIGLIAGAFAWALNK